jgi:hypothetical protein
LINNFLFLGFDFVSSKTPENPHRLREITHSYHPVNYNMFPSWALELKDSLDRVHNTLWKLVNSKSTKGSNKSCSFRLKEIRQVLKKSSMLCKHKNCNKKRCDDVNDDLTDTLT